MSGSPVYTRWEGCVDLRRALHVQGFVRTLVVEDLDELVEPSLLLQKIGSRRLGGFFFQGQMHALMSKSDLGRTSLSEVSHQTKGFSQGFSVSADSINAWQPRQAVACVLKIRLQRKSYETIRLWKVGESVCPT